MALPIVGSVYIIVSRVPSNRRCSPRTKPELHVDSRRSALQDTEGPHNRWGHAVLGLVDLEVLEGTLSLSAPVLVRGDVNLAEGIGLSPGLCHGACGNGERSV